MHRNTLVLILCCLLALAFTACAKTQQTATVAPDASTGPCPAAGAVKITSTDVVKPFTPEVSVAAGGTADASVRVVISKCYHINANPPSASYLIATELKAEPTDGITAEKPVYPAPVTKKFSFSEQPLAVYEGEAMIRLPLRAANSASKGAHTVPLKLRVQACDNQVCYQPGTLDTAIQVSVK